MPMMFLKTAALTLLLLVIPWFVEGFAVGANWRIPPFFGASVVLIGLLVWIGLSVTQVADEIRRAADIAALK